MKKYCLTLDLKNDPELIREYEEYHKNVWPEIMESIAKSGIIGMKIYRLNTRLCMIMETNEDFSFEMKAKNDSSNPRVKEWENLMWKYQEALPGSGENEKWILMKEIFSL